MFRRIATLAALAMAGAVLLAPASAFSIEALALKVLGFSPDGRYFGFIQYGGQGDGGEYLAETYVIDASRDRFAPGSPVRIDTIKEQAILPDVEDAPKKLLALALKRSQPLIARYALSKPSQMLVRVPEAYAEEPQSGSGGPTSGAKQVTATHPALGELKIDLTLKPFNWPKTSKVHNLEGAGTCAKEVDWEKGAGFRLTLERNGQTIVLNDDKTIPASRFCALNYGLAEVHAFDRPDGKVTLAVLVGMEVRAFEGNDRLFLAVTKVLDR